MDKNGENRTVIPFSNTDENKGEITPPFLFQPQPRRAPPPVRAARAKPEVFTRSSQSRFDKAEHLTIIHGVCVEGMQDCKFVTNRDPANATLVRRLAIL